VGEDCLLWKGGRDQPGGWMLTAGQRKTWTRGYSPPKPPVPDNSKAEAETTAEALVGEFLRPQFLKPPPRSRSGCEHQASSPKARGDQPSRRSNSSLTAR
jgi:hypothetical protein